MAYLNEDGLETLVGKIKGQVIELTSAEYRQLPATKNTDNKLYFVNDEAYAYQIDDEPTSGSSGLVKSGGVYNWTSKIGSGTLTTTAQTLIPAVNELNAKIGSTDISAIGDGTVTGAVDELNKGLMYESTTITDNYGTVYNCKKYNNGDIEICDVVDIVFHGSSEGPYNGMYRSRETRSFPTLTRIDFAFAQGTNSNVFISSTQPTSDNNTILYVAQSINTIAQGLTISSISMLIRGRWK